MFSAAYVFLSVTNKTQMVWLNFQEHSKNGITNNWLHFGRDLDHHLDQGIFSKDYLDGKCFAMTTSAQNRWLKKVMNFEVILSDIVWPCTSLVFWSVKVYRGYWVGCLAFCGFSQVTDPIAWQRSGLCKCFYLCFVFFSLILPGLLILILFTTSYELILQEASISAQFCLFHFIT